MILKRFWKLIFLDYAIAVGREGGLDSLLEGCPNHSGKQAVPVNGLEGFMEVVVIVDNME